MMYWMRRIEEGQRGNTEDSAIQHQYKSKPKKREQIPRNLNHLIQWVA
jgi:hypothetical protein